MPDTRVKEIREQYDYAAKEWQDIRREAQTDMRCLMGDVWEALDANGVRARRAANRPMLALDELGQYVNQLTNEVRMQKRAIRVSAVGAGATDRLARFRQNLIRQIEYESNAQEAYTEMFENAVQRGYGFLRVKADYVAQDSFEQKLMIEPLANPEMVYPDPDATRADLSDMTWCTVREPWLIKDFKRTFKGASVTTFEGEGAREAGAQWVDTANGRVWLGEHWSIRKKPRRLLLLEPAPVQGVAVAPVAVWEDEIPRLGMRGAAVKLSRDVDVPSVVVELTNGIEVLRTTEWPGTYIPIVACLGKVFYVDQGSGLRKTIMSLVRLARDPFMLYCYYRTCEAELIGMTPKTPFVGYRGQFDGVEEDWQRVNAEPLAYLEANAQTQATGQQVLPLPQRQPYDPPIQALEVGAESARRAIQAAMGVAFLPTNAQRQNDKSGVALQKIEQSQQKGSYHFVDHFEMALRHTGVILKDLIPHYYDTERELTVRKPDDTPVAVRINVDDPTTPEDESRIGDVGVGRYDVTISTGPSADSEREAASNFADSLVQNPHVFPLIGPLVVKLKNLGPIGDEIAKALEVLQPSELRPKPEGAPQIPPEVEQQMAQMKQMLDMASAKVRELEQTIQTDSVKAQRDVQLAQLKGEIEARLAQIDGAIKVEIEEVKGALALQRQDDQQRHEVGIAAEAQAASARQMTTMPVMESE